MNKAWLKAIFGAFCEVIWVTGMKHSTIWWEILGTITAIFIGFHALAKAGEKLPVGTAYTAFVGLGSAGTIAADHFSFHISLDIGKVPFLLLLLIGVISLKMVAGNKEGETR